MTVERYATLAEASKLKADEFNFNIPRYVDTLESEDRVDRAAVQREITDLKAQLAEAESRMAEYLRELGLDG
jgi:type I restriction enzyme M protein